jgi:hypothetical protein
VWMGGIAEPREPFAILAGILTTRSGWSPPFGEPLVNAITEVEPEGRLDLGAVAEAGAFEITYEADGRPHVTASDPEAWLMFFLTRLYTRLQQLGTVTAVDLAEYSRPLEAD